MFRPLPAEAVAQTKPAMGAAVNAPNKFEACDAQILGLSINVCRPVYLGLDWLYGTAIYCQFLGSFSSRPNPIAAGPMACALGGSNRSKVVTGEKNED